jgi:NAD(P)H-nitrite reductase large subunit
LIGKGHVAVYGGGLIAVEIAVHLLEAGYQVELIVRSRVLRQYFNQEVGDQIEDILIRKGVQIRKGVTIQKNKRNKERVEIVLSGGHSLNTDLLVMCTGVRPRITFLQKTGIALNKGILVDRRMMTNLTDVYAAGDVAEAPDFFTGSQIVSPILINAMEQGKIAGSNMAGKEAFYTGSIRGNLLTFFGNTAFSIGVIDHSNKGYEVFQKSANRGHKYLKLVFDRGFLVGVESLNQDIDPGIFHSLISRRVKINPYEGLLTENPAKAGRWLLFQDRMRPNL